MSLAHRIRKQTAMTGELQLSALLFGSLPATSEETKAERARLLAEFRGVMATMAERSPLKLLRYLRRSRKEYNPAEHGHSQLMQLIDYIDALRECEKEDRDVQGKAGNGSH